MKFTKSNLEKFIRNPKNNVERSEFAYDSKGRIISCSFEFFKSRKR